jgi:hypothetical protein
VRRQTRPARLGIDAAEALHHAHEQGSSTATKPSNLLIDARGTLLPTARAHVETGTGLI